MEVLIQVIRSVGYVNNTIETKMKIIKQPKDRESFTLIRFSLDLSRSIVCSINCEGKVHN